MEFKMVSLLRLCWRFPTGGRTGGLHQHRLSRFAYNGRVRTQDPVLAPNLRRQDRQLGDWNISGGRARGRRHWGGGVPSGPETRVIGRFPLEEDLEADVVG